MAYEDYRVLIDDPTALPGLGFDQYGAAFADIIRRSDPQFAIGIFGSWGSGKTTLMRTIERQLVRDDDVVTVWFNAWRYEREEHLIVPLLDTMRESLLAASTSAEPDARQVLRRAAGKIVRAGKAILAGLSVQATAKAPLVGEVSATLDASKIISNLEKSVEAPEDSLSFYHSAFTMLREAISEFSHHGDRRVVVFVDDLDRCLPDQALQVLESMKAFFDIEGCLFVVGLDDEIVTRAVAWKYRAATETASVPIQGAEYIKKVFQVPFQLPRISAARLDQYLTAVVDGQSLSGLQTADIKGAVRAHLHYLQGEDRINPREVKRLLNAYVLQLKVLSVTLGVVNPHVVLGLQSLYFRPDWRSLYDELVKDPTLFQKSLQDAVGSGAGTMWVNGVSVVLPPSFLTYLGDVGKALLGTDLDEYALAAESTSSTSSVALDGQTALNRLRGLVEGIVAGDLGPEMISRFEGDVYRLESTLGRSSAVSSPADLLSMGKQLHDLAADTSAERADRVSAWGQTITRKLGALDAQLQEQRRRSSAPFHA